MTVGFVGVPLVRRRGTEIGRFWQNAVRSLSSNGVDARRQAAVVAGVDQVAADLAALVRHVAGIANAVAAAAKPPTEPFTLALKGPKINASWRMKP